MAGGFLNIRRQPQCMSKPTASPSPAKKIRAPVPSEAGTLASKADEEKWDVTKPLRNGVGKFRAKDMRVRLLVLAILIVASAAILRYMLDYPLSAMQKFFGAAVLLLITGEIIRGWMDWDGFLGLIMFRDRSTLGWIDRQAQRHAVLWKTLADVGAVMGYGLSSYFLLGKKQREPKRLLLVWAAGLPLLVIFFLFVMPTAYVALRSAIGISELNAASQQMHSAVPLQGELDRFVGDRVGRASDGNRGEVAWVEGRHRVERGDEGQRLTFLDGDVPHVRRVDRLHALLPQRILDGARNQIVRDVVQDLILVALLDDAGGRFARPEAGHARFARVVGGDAIDLGGDYITGDFDAHIPARRVDVDEFGFHG